jgi:murein L,D-transpeptidase YafK
LKFCLPPPKTTLKAGGEKLQLEKVKKRKKGSNMTDSEDSDESDFRQAWKKYKKAHHEAKAAGLSWKSGRHGTMPAIHLSHQDIAQGFLV